MFFQGTNQTTDTVDSIYVAAFEGDLFQATLDLISSACGKATVLIVGQDGGKLAGNFILQKGSPVEVSRLFLAELSATDGWLRQQWEIELGRVYQESDLGTPEMLSGGPVGQALCAEKPALDCIMGIVVSRVGTRQIAIEVRFPKFRQTELRGRLKSLLQRTARHLAFAMRIASMRRQLTETDHLVSSLLDLAPYPVVLIDADHRICRMSARAEAMTGDGQVFGTGPDRVLHIANQEADVEFAQQLSRIRPGQKQRMALIKVPRDGGQRQEVVSAIRLDNPSMIGLGLTAGPSENIPRFAVVCENLSTPAELSYDTLWRVFGLSSKEADLAVALLSGDTIGDVAVRRKTSKETLRNQLSAVMRKTATTRQQDLVAVLTRLATVNSVA
ncbi:hypothetical protein GALL_393900 [mine drainage metagenome]|uniref:HTH luxR-type domain-containing protein n=1 Tax=mine drainage metagenome TaxID=410659 RepID=A0A1J5QFX7_9ZZZZ